MKNRKITRRNATNFGLGASADEWDGLLTAMRKKGYGDGELLASGLAIRGKNGGLYDKFRKRLIFPIIDVRGDVLGFGGRIISKMCIRDRSGRSAAPRPGGWRCGSEFPTGRCRQGRPSR